METIEIKILNFSGRTIESFKSLKKQWYLIYPLLIACILSLVYIYMNYRYLNLKSASLFNEIIDPVITIFTFTTALLIGWYNLYLTWINNLEKRLTVFFVFYYESIDKLESTLKFKKAEAELEKHKGFISKKGLKPKTPYCLIICEEALLAHEGDIRNWGQQLGSQYDALGKLSFHPFFTLGKNDAVLVRKKKDETLVTKQYTLFIFLDKIPETILTKGTGSLSTDNYDDKPTNENLNIEITEIDYKNLLEYSKSKKFIDSIRPK